MICDGVHHAMKKGLSTGISNLYNILITEHGMVKSLILASPGPSPMPLLPMATKILWLSPLYFSGTRPKARQSTAPRIFILLVRTVRNADRSASFSADSAITVAMKHIHDEITPPRRFNPDIPAALESIIMLAMQKNPKQRFASAQEMRNALLSIHIYRRKNIFKSAKKKK
jgi:serine/threonine-protein kinase